MIPPAEAVALYGLAFALTFALVAPLVFALALRGALRDALNRQDSGAQTEVETDGGRRRGATDAEVRRAVETAESGD